MHVADFRLHGRISRSLPLHALPPATAISAMARFRSWWPLHSAVQALQGLHIPQEQSICFLCQQARVPHFLKSCTLPLHWMPSWVASTITDLERCCKPPPHVTVQDCQSFQDENSQSRASVGQGCVLHASTRMLSFLAQALPPFRATCATLRVRLLWPPPHVTEHADGSVHEPQTQSCCGGHGSGLQGWRSTERPLQSRPVPSAFCTTLR